jgi:hypothetical protein
LISSCKFLPGIVFLVPLFVIYRQFGLINTLWGVALSHIIIVLPLVIWIMIGFFEDIPRSSRSGAHRRQQRAASSFASSCRSASPASSRRRSSASSLLEQLHLVSSLAARTR